MVETVRGSPEKSTSLLAFSQINVVCCKICKETCTELFFSAPLWQCWRTPRRALWKLGCSWAEALYCSSSAALGWHVLPTSPRGEWVFCVLCHCNLACWSACHCPLEEGTRGEETGPGCARSPEPPHLCSDTGEQGKQGLPPIVFRECLHWLQRLLSRSAFLHF